MTIITAQPFCDFRDLTIVFLCRDSALLKQFEFLELNHDSALLKQALVLLSLFIRLVLLSLVFAVSANTGGTSAKFKQA